MDTKLRWLIVVVVVLGAFFAPTAVKHWAEIALAWHGNLSGSADCDYAHVVMEAVPPEGVTVHTIDGVEAWSADHQWAEEEEYTFHGFIQWNTGETWEGNETIQKPECPTPTVPCPTNTPTQSQPIFEWSVYATCQHIEIRVHNQNDFVVHVVGEIYAQNVGEQPQIIGQVDEECAPDGWCGPLATIGEHYAYFDGIVWGETNVYYQGVLVDQRELGETNLICGNPPTETPFPTATNTPEPSPTPTSTTPPPTWNFKWDQGVNCTQPWLRFHNLNNVTVHVQGEMWLNGVLYKWVPEPYANVPPDQWGGIENDLPQNFVGELFMFDKITYQGVEVGYREIREQLNCASPTQTPTTTPPTPTTTSTQPPTSTQPAETPIPGTPVPAPNTGFDGSDLIVPVLLFALLIVLGFIGYRVFNFRKIV
jgi:hypothetical protein